MFALIPKVGANSERLSTFKAAPYGRLCSVARRESKENNTFPSGTRRLKRNGVVSISLLRSRLTWMIITHVKNEEIYEIAGYRFIAIKGCQDEWIINVLFFC
jgi:hypothetical protein